jgi:hypothetical protein
MSMMSSAARIRDLTGRHLLLSHHLNLGITASPDDGLWSPTRLDDL